MLKWADGHLCHLAWIYVALMAHETFSCVRTMSSHHSSRLCRSGVSNIWCVHMISLKKTKNIFLYASTCAVCNVDDAVCQLNAHWLKRVLASSMFLNTLLNFVC